MEKKNEDNDRYVHIMEMYGKNKRMYKSITYA
jgi:hypothetical protein